MLSALMSIRDYAMLKTLVAAIGRQPRRRRTNDRFEFLALLVSQANWNIQPRCWTHGGLAIKDSALVFARIARLNSPPAILPRKAATRRRNGA